jgi:hypothetical protein
MEAIPDMEAAPPPPTNVELEKLELDRRRLESDDRFRMAELDLKREEFKVREAREQKGSFFKSPHNAPVLVAVLGLIAAGASAAIAWYSSTQLERSKFEYALIQKALEIKDRREAAKNLKFLVDVGVIKSLDSQKITSLAADPESLPTYSSSAPISAGFTEGMKFRDAIQMISGDTGITVGLRGCTEPAISAEIVPGKVSANSPAALIEMLKHRIKDPAVKLDYQVKEISSGKYDVVCAP